MPVILLSLVPTWQPRTQSLFICDLTIKISNIKEIPPLLTIDLNFFLKLKCIILEKLHHVVF